MRMNPNLNVEGFDNIERHLDKIDIYIVHKFEDRSRLTM